MERIRKIRDYRAASLKESKLMPEAIDEENRIRNRLGSPRRKMAVTKIPRQKAQ